MLQHSGGQLCPQQSAACGLLTESSKTLFSPTLPEQAYTNTDSRDKDKWSDSAPREGLIILLLHSLKIAVCVLSVFVLSYWQLLFFLQELFGAVQVSPLSSGYSLGSSNWIIQSHHEKVSYVSGSSLLTTHPQVSQQATLEDITQVACGGKKTIRSRMWYSTFKLKSQGPYRRNVLS